MCVFLKALLHFFGGKKATEILVASANYIAFRDFCGHAREEKKCAKTVVKTDFFSLSLLYYFLLRHGEMLLTARAFEEFRLFTSDSPNFGG